MLKTACEETVNWPDHVKVAVNLSPTQLTNRNLVEVVKKALAESGLDARRLQLEITETVLLQNTFATLARLHELRKLGAQIALDDFGTGYSSLSYFAASRSTRSRSISRSFRTCRMARNPCDRQRGGGLGDSLNMISTAEGVETNSKWTPFSPSAASETQGYLFSRARPAKEIAQFFPAAVASEPDVA